jgi:hypothetical protein
MNNLVRVGLHAEMQKFGRKTTGNVGLVLSYTESRALFAVQKLLDGTDYAGNMTPEKLPADNPSKYTGQLPGIEFRLSEYLSAYGVAKYKSARNKMEYSGAERAAAVSALEALGLKKYTMKYTRIDWKSKKKDRTQIEYTAPVIWRPDTHAVYAGPILVDQIDTYFVWKPMDLYEQASGTDVLFIEYLLCMAEQARRRKGPYTVKLDPDTMAHVLRLDKLIATRQWSRIRAKLDMAYAVAKDLGYLADYAVNQPGKKVEQVDVLQLNKQKFEEMRNGNELRLAA